MRWHVKTRSRNKDYLFIGGAPERWWARFGVDTSFERPTLLVERPAGGAEWRLLASGIPSVRRDLHQTQLRYTIVGAGETGQGLEPALRLAAAWLDEAAAILATRDAEAGPGAAPLRLALDEAFSEDVIEEWLAADPAAPELAARAQALLLDALARLPAAPAAPGSVEGGWYGSLHAPACRAAFLGRVGDLLDGSADGVACVLNLADRAEQLKTDLDDHRTALLFDVPPDQAPEPTPLPRPAASPAKKKGAEAGREGRRGPGEPPRPPRQPPALGSAGSPADARGGGGGAAPAPLNELQAAPPPCGPEAPPPADEGSGGEAPAQDAGAGAPGDDAREPPQGPNSLLRCALPGRDVVRKVKEAGRETLEVLGAGRETLEEVLGSSRQTLEHIRKEVTAVAREGASRGAREVIEAVVTGTRALSQRVEELPQLLGVEPPDVPACDEPAQPEAEADADGATPEGTTDDPADR